MHGVLRLCAPLRWSDDRRNDADAPLGCRRSLPEEVMRQPLEPAKVSAIMEVVSAIMEVVAAIMDVTIGDHPAAALASSPMA